MGWGGVGPEGRRESETGTEGGGEKVERGAELSPSLQAARVNANRGNPGGPFALWIVFQ